MTQDPIIDAAAVAAPAIGYTVGTNMLYGPVAAVGGSVPAACVFVAIEDSSKPVAYLGKGASTYAAEVEFTVRGEPGAKDAPRQVARAIRDALHLADVLGYYDVSCEDSEPEYVREDAIGCHEWAVAFTLAWTA